VAAHPAGVEATEEHALDWLRPRRPPGAVLRADVDLPAAELTALARAGRVVRVTDRVHLTAEAAAWRSGRTAALAAVLGPEQVARGVVGLRAAAWAHGADVDPAPVDLLVPRAVAPWRLPPGVREVTSDVPAAQVVTVTGVRLTSPARTAADVARRLPPDVAGPLVAALLARGAQVDDVLALVDQEHWPWAVRARELVRRFSRTRAPGSASSGGR
jgi:hypothetical protein